MKTGDRVRMVYMPNDPNPIPPGTEGTVEDINRIQLGPRGERSFTQLRVKWDNGRSLMCVTPPDQLEVIQPSVPAEEAVA
jgi:hypothetical protein